MKNKLTARYFRGYGFSSETIIDVGVLSGTPFLYDSFPGAKFVLIDPLEESEISIQKQYDGKLDYDFHLMGVGSKAATIELAVTPGSMAKASSNKRVEKETSPEQQIRKIPVKQLDTVMKSYSGPFGLKIDTEGHELEVLKGAKKTLKDCEFVITETSIKRRFENNYKFSDIITFMASQGFEAHSFLSGFTRSPRMSDVLFVPYDSPRFNMRHKV